MQRTRRVLPLLIPLSLLSSGAHAREGIEFVAEHLAEIAMDNRYASLPLWNACEVRSHADSLFCFGVSATYGRTHSATLSIDGPMLALSATHPVGETYRLTGFAFFDDFSLGSGIEHRPLDTLFADVPLSQPVSAQFAGLDGKASDLGFGFALNGTASIHWLGSFEWSAGLMWQQFKLRDYRFDYLITEGPDIGTMGTIDYSATYTHISPFLGAAWPRSRGVWEFTPHVQLALPRPRRGIAGRITGPGFDLTGNTADQGTGTPFGDPSVTIGFDVTYRPWNLTVDLGSTFTQALIEPQIHEGVQRNLLLSAHWTF